MASTTLELDGVTSFRSRPSTSYRFVLTLKSDKLNVWLEDRKSKEQWQSGFIALDAFVTSQNAIPGATLAEYANCFKRALEKTDGKQDDPVERELRIDADNGLKLEFVVHIKVFEVLWSPKYSLVLKPIAIERIDILESRLFDVEQEIERCSQVEMTSVISEFKMSNRITGAGKAVWSAQSGIGFAVDAKGDIRALADGTFVVALQAPYSVTCHDASIALVKSDENVLLETVFYDPNARNSYDYYGDCNLRSGCSGFVAVSVVLELKAGDKFAFKARKFTMDAGAKMVIAKVACR